MVPKFESEASSRSFRLSDDDSIEEVSSDFRLDLPSGEGEESEQPLRTGYFSVGRKGRDLSARAPCTRTGSGTGRDLRANFDSRELLKSSGLEGGVWLSSLRVFQIWARGVKVGCAKAKRRGNVASKQRHGEPDGAAGPALLPVLGLHKCESGVLLFQTPATTQDPTVIVHVNFISFDFRALAPGRACPAPKMRDSGVTCPTWSIAGGCSHLPA